MYVQGKTVTYQVSLDLWAWGKYLVDRLALCGDLTPLAPVLCKSDDDPSKVNYLLLRSYLGIY
jgi:hypothetical protein